MLTGYYIKDGKVMTFDHVDRIIEPEPVKTDLILLVNYEAVEAKRHQRDWKAWRRNKIRCNLIRASECIAAVVMCVLAMLPAAESFEMRQLPALIGFMAIPGGWIGLVTYATQRKKGTSAATE